jgi:choline dehydrogenase-like flavoprotein/nucleoside-diphosphate-sugar epimerase
MTKYIDLQTVVSETGMAEAFDILVVGSGAAGLTIVRALVETGARIGLLESGALEQTADHENLNAVDVTGQLNDTRLQEGRTAWHGGQLPLWSSETQKFGVRCRVLGGSTAGWAGKVAPFDPLDYDVRSWIPLSGWPVTSDDMKPWLISAAKALDLGPLVDSDSFWKEAARDAPREVSALEGFRAFFWQFARSRHAMTDVMRFGPDFQREDHRNVTVLYNATVGRILCESGHITGVEVLPSLTGSPSRTLKTRHVVLAAGAIENARLMLLSKDENGRSLGNDHDMVGRCLMDHPCVSLGEFGTPHLGEASRLLGFYAIRKGDRAYMYALGLALKPSTQRDNSLPNIAVFASPTISDDDPLFALKRLGSRESKNRFKDLTSVIGSPILVTTSVGRKMLESSKIPSRIRRMIADATVWLNANFVARNYISKGTGRKIERLTLELISEQPPSRENRVSLSNDTDRLGLPKALISWEVDQKLRENVLQAALLLLGDMDRAGISGFKPAHAIMEAKASSLVLRDMAHTAGTTRMGADPTHSVVDADCQVHGVQGLHLAGASIFPTSGHANPTMMIMAFALRLADHLKPKLRQEKVRELAAAFQASDRREGLRVLVTGATGNLGSEVIAELQRKGFRVRGQYRNRIPDDPNVEWKQLDFAAPDLSDEAFEALVDGADAVIHLAASLAEYPEQMETANVVNLERFATICAARGVRYFGQASSMVVYGSPRTPLVSEDSPLIDVNAPIEKQYYSDSLMHGYARSKRMGEIILQRVAGEMRVDLYRIAVAQPSSWLEQTLHWGRARRTFALYRNTHFISSRNAARAMVHLMTRALNNKDRGIEAFNICDRNSPTWREVWRNAGRTPGSDLPLVFDVLQGARLGRSTVFRYPHGAFRMDDSRLLATGFVWESDSLES